VLLSDAGSPARTIYGRTRGSGRPIVFLHGAFATHSDWPDLILDGALRHGRIIVVDRPGHGETPRRRFKGDARDQARQLEQGLGLDRPAIFVGHSFGALSALAFADLFPDQVSALVLIAPVCFPEWRLEQLFLGPRALPGFGPALSRVWNASIDRVYLSYIQRMMFAPQPVPEEWLERYPTERILSPSAFAREGEDAIASSPLGIGAYRLQAPSQPVSLLQGNADAIIIGGWHARYLHQLSPASRLIRLNGVGHMAHHAAPAQVIQEIARYV
jgi:pimeloyl-ACP methyl ester carboxylesterase